MPLSKLPMVASHRRPCFRGSCLQLPSRRCLRQEPDSETIVTEVWLATRATSSKNTESIAPPKRRKITGVPKRTVTCYVINLTESPLLPKWTRVIETLVCSTAGALCQSSLGVIDFRLHLTVTTNHHNSGNRHWHRPPTKRRSAVCTLHSAESSPRS